MTGTQRHVLFALLCMALGCGCHTSPPFRPGLGRHLPDQPILVLPVLAAERSLAETGAALSQAIRQETTAVLGSTAIFAEDFASLRSTMTTDNLCRDGQLVLSEIATLADVAGCGASLVVVLAAADSYMPQNLTGKAVLVETRTGAVLAERVLRLDLADPETMAAYRHYLQHVRGFRVGNLESSHRDRIHTAMLSPSQFRRFAAHALVADLFADQETPPPLQLRRHQGQPLQ